MRETHVEREMKGLKKLEKLRKLKMGEDGLGSFGCKMHGKTGKRVNEREVQDNKFKKEFEKIKSNIEWNLERVGYERRIRG